jgi:hypothetical protein
MVDNMASHRSARVGARKESIVSDLTFLLAFLGSIVALALPIVVILRLLLVDGADGITDLFLARRWDEGGGPAEEEAPPRWRPELLRRRQTQYPAVSPKSIEIAAPVIGAAFSEQR